MTLNKVEMYKTYFLAMKLLLAVSTLLIVKSQLNYFHWGSLLFSLLGLLVIAIQFIAIIKAEKLIIEKNFLGITIGLVVSILSLGGLTLPLGLWGLYSLLNRDFITHHAPRNSPSWFNENIHSKLLKF